MIKRSRAVFVASALMASSLYAHAFSGGPGYGGGCPPCEGKWRFDAEFLYFMPSVDDTYFLIVRPTLDLAAPAKRINNDFDFEPGFRVGLAYDLCGCCEGELQAYYTRLKTHQSRTVGGSDRFLSATVGQALFANNFENYIGSAESDLHFLYQRVDGFYSYPLWDTSCLNLDGLIGLEYAYARFKEFYTFRPIVSGARGILEEEAKTYGIGPQLGLNCDYLICETPCWCPGTLSLGASSSASLLTSKTRLTTFNRDDNLVFINLNDEHTWRIIPAFHARIGLNYATCFSCWGASLEVGYEFNSYLRELVRHSFPDDVSPDLCYTCYYNVDVQGLYVALNASF